MTTSSTIAKAAVVLGNFPVAASEKTDKVEGVDLSYINMFATTVLILVLTVGLVLGRAICVKAKKVETKAIGIMLRRVCGGEPSTSEDDGRMCLFEWIWTKSAS